MSLFNQLAGGVGPNDSGVVVNPGGVKPTSIIDAGSALRNIRQTQIKLRGPQVVAPSNTVFGIPAAGLAVIALAFLLYKVLK